MGNAPAKLLKDFVKKGDTLPLLKGAYVEETVYLGADQLDALAAIKSKNELIADVVARPSGALRGHCPRSCT